MTTKRKPVLPQVNEAVGLSQVSFPGLHRVALPQLRAAEAVIRAARRAARDLPNDAIDRGQMDYLFRALSRLDNLTRRPIQRTP